MNYFAAFWGASFMLHPFILMISQKPGMLYGKDLFFLVSVLFSVLLFNRPKRDFPKVETGIIAVLLISAFFGMHDFLAMGARYQFMFIFIGALFTKHLYENLDECSERLILNAISIVGVVSAIWGFINIAGHSPYTWYVELFTTAQEVSTKFDFPAGPLNNVNLTGAYLALSLPALNRPRWRYLIPLIVAALLVNTSVMPRACAFAYVLFIIWDKFVPKNRALPFVAAAVAMIGFFVVLGPQPLDGIDSGRFLTWKLNFSLVTVKAFFLGNGPGWFHDFFSDIYLPHGLQFREEHNEFIAAFNTWGIFGLLAILFLIYRSIQRSGKVFAVAGLFIAFCSSYANFIFHISPLAAVVLFYYVAGLKGQTEEVMS